MLHACAKAGRDEEAQECWRAMEAEGLVPTRVTFNILIRSFVRRQVTPALLFVWERFSGVGVLNIFRRYQQYVAFYIRSVFRLYVSGRFKYSFGSLRALMKPPRGNCGKHPTFGISSI